MLVAILGVFKYYDFFAVSFATTLEAVGIPVGVTTLNIILPVGVSFYVFQSIGYLVDVYRGDTKPESNFVDFALFVSFFPQLVAGPIERSKNLLRQIKIERPDVTGKDISYGLYLIAQGFVKKVVIADNLGPLADALFNEHNLSGPLIWVGLIIFAIQIYCDFSGYTDIARGYSRLLGFRILLNFDRPYIATSPSDFWRRWHISLSNWFTEYVYFPLGGNRSKSETRRSINVLATMSLSGLWHGASWNFLFWGIYHGAIILLSRTVKSFVPNNFAHSAAGKAVGIIVTFILTVYGWLYFRVTDFSQILAFNHALLFNWHGGAVAVAFLAQGALYLLIWVMLDVLELYWLDVRGQQVRERRGFVIYVTLMILIVLLFQAHDPSAFIYFRF
ncbi:MAG: MBOAT family O-acyltransferase [Maricaulis sp.]|nr:MBOAT family O-acyltransferase [Maricaulis sp.]